MAEEQKKARRTRKSSLTREIGNIERFIAEENKDEVSTRVKLLMVKFSDFEEAHEVYHDALIEESEIDESEAYFEDVLDKYIQILTCAKKWLSDTEAKLELKPVTAPAKGTDVHNDKVSWSKDKQVIELCENDVQLINSHNDIQAPWMLDNSYPMDDTLVASRVNSPHEQLEVNMSSITGECDAEMRMLLDIGYTETVPESDLSNRDRPLQEMTAPRPELQPAVLSACSDVLLTSELGLDHVMSTYYPSWYKLKCDVALCRHLLHVLKSKDEALCGTILTVHVFWEAEVVTVRHVQCQEYSSEMELLASRASPSKSCSVSDLLLMPGDNGIMSCGEHLKYADLPSDRTHPIVKYKHPLNHDVTDMLPLTSNHMLLLPGRPPPVSGIFSQNDMYRDEWECAQHLSNQFWFRWLSVYLPGLLVLIIQQNKWHNKERNVQVGYLRTISTALVRPVTRFV